MSLILRNKIHEGWYRDCYLHPDDENKIVKIQKNKKDDLLKLDIFNYKKTKDALGNFCVKYDENLINTNVGKGIICELIRDDNGDISRNLDDFLQNDTLSKDYIKDLYLFSEILLKNNLFFFDVANAANFLVQIKNGKQHLKFPDLKRFNNSNLPIKINTLEYLPKFFSRLKLKRRLRKLYNYLGIKYKF